MNLKKTLILTLILLGGILFISAFVHIPSAIQSGKTVYPLLSFKKSDRVMIIAPHPDDEALAAAGIIRYCVNHNIPVKVVIVTNGGSDLAGQRHTESLEAMKKLGLNDNITFLDYPQVGLTHLLAQNWNKPYMDPKGISHSMNKFSHNPGAPYTGESLAMELEDVIYDFKPTVIIYPDSNDLHQDHWATSAFVEYAITKLNYNCTTLGYMIHTPSNSWPSPHSYSPSSYLTPPSYLSAQEDWVEFPLTEKDEEFKASAIKSYKSQLKKGSYFLLSFVRKNELFSIQHPITISKNSSTGYPNLIFKDPENDVKKLTTSIETGIKTSESLVDLTNTSFETNNNGTCISLQTKDKISANNIYKFHLLIIYGNNTTAVMDIQIKNGKYHINHYGTTLSNLTFINTRNAIIIKIPIIFKKGDNVILSAEAIDSKGKSTDRSPWQIIKIT